MREVVNVTPLENYCILAEFSNGEKRVCDIKPLLSKPVFSPLIDKALFNKAYIEYGAVTWKDNNGNEIDICSDKLYMDSFTSEKGSVI
ncbi:MAG: DUF2442 domain-containing protein [Ruminococcus sp.]|nr:DUF2442 domain-containing protein [Ruminococcus sp.]